MSLATTSAGAGGLSAASAMGHHAGAVAHVAAPPRPPTGGAGIPGGAAPPVSNAALGADLVDKHQQALSLKQARGVAHLPIVAVDLYSSEPNVAMFPPKAEEGMPPGSPSVIGKMKSDLYFHGNNETAHKTLRKYLTKSKTFTSLQIDTLTAPADGVVKMERPQQWLGIRRTGDAPKFIQSKASIQESTGAIAEEASADVGVSISNSTLDGSEPQGDDFDRAVFKVRLHSQKKALTVLPEEGVQMLLHQAQYHVAAKMKVDKEDEEIPDYPCAVALPAWQCHDAAVEALMDGMGGSGVMFQRSICALVGALRPGPKEKPNLVLKAINDVRIQRAKDHQLEKIKNPDAIMEEDVSLLLFGMTEDGFECTAVQVAGLQPEMMECLFGDIKVLSNVSYQAEDPISIMEKCVKELQANLEALLPDMELPPAIASYGSPEQQSAIEKKWEEIKGKSTKAWKDIPMHKTKTDSVAMGAATLGAVSHGRIRTIVQAPGAKPKAQLAIRVANVAPVAVGVRMNYHGDSKKKWTEVKTIFDFDRRVPAGPYALDLKASECVVHRKPESSEMSDEEFLKAAEAVGGSKGIPQREEAARNLRVQVYQKWTRDGAWKKVGDVKKPLVIEGKDGEQIACEHAVFELSLGPTGIITADLHGEGESVVQATESARNSTLRYWIGIILAVAFFGGFLVKSYWEERVFERDTKRLLAYYKHVLPGSIQDGDEHNARYLVWKYRGKKDKLWRVLEKKYGEPVLHAHEWPDAAVEEEKDDEEEEQDLDEGEESPSENQPEEKEQEAEQTDEKPDQKEEL